MAKPPLSPSSGKRKKQGLLSHKDIMRGFTGYVNKGMDIWSLAPIQCLPLEEKTEEWIKWNADWFENVAIRELPKKAARLQKLYNMTGGIINKSDYVYSPNSNDLSNHIKAINGENQQTLLDQFFPIVPPIYQMFMGEKTKRKDTVIVDAVDPESLNEKLEFKMSRVSEALEEYAVQRKQAILAAQGIIPSDNQDDPMTQQYIAEVQAAQKLAQAQTQFKKFRTNAAIWGQNFKEKFDIKHRFYETELEGFSDNIIADEAIFALNLRENDFTPEGLRPISTYVNISQNEVYYSKANFVVNVEFMSIPDIINKFRNDLNADQIEALELHYTKTFSGSDNIMFGQDVGNYDTYWDKSKPYSWNIHNAAPNIREHKSDEAVKNFLFSLTNDKSISNYANNFEDLNQIRVSRIWWPSQRRIGKLTKIIEGDPEPVVTTVDENFIVTEHPEYDNSLLKEESALTVIKGEHIDWQYVIQWRYVVKIGQNRPYYNTVTPNNDFQSIYLYGEPIRFQFKGDLNLYDSKPPIEGCKFSNKNTISMGLIEQLKPWQIIYNILNNKVVQILPYDYGKVLVANKSTIPRNSLLNEDGIEPVTEFLDNLKETRVMFNNDSRDAIQETSGRQIQPTMIDLGVIEQASLYLQTAQFVKSQAYEAVGVTMQRLGDIGNRETAGGVQQATESSVNQTEMLFDKFANRLMPRVWQMILEAGQYYTVQSEEFQDAYINSELNNEYFSVLKTDLLLRDLLVMAVSKADLRKLMDDLKTLAMQDNTMGATFLDKVKTFNSQTPVELIEKLEIAEQHRKDEIKQQQDHEAQMQQQQMEAQAKMQQEAQAIQDKQFYDKLLNERIIADKKNNSVAEEAPDNSDMFESQKMQQNQQSIDDKRDLEDRKLQMQQRSQSENADLEREKMQVAREKMQSDENIAIQNKSDADLKFKQQQKAKAKK